MLGVIIHFLIQLAVVVLTAGEDFAEQGCCLFSAPECSMMLQASSDCFPGSPNTE